MKKILIVLIVTIILFPSICFVQDIELKKNGLVRLLFDVNKQGDMSEKLKLKGKIYVIGVNSLCEGDFVLVQLLKPNLLIYTFSPPSRTCWDFGRFVGYSIAILIDEKSFEKIRYNENIIGSTTSSLVTKNPPQKVKVIDIMNVELVNGTIKIIPIIEFIKENK